MNILFTCAGRRNYLIDYFKSIKDVRTFACDTSIYAPALYTADEYFIVPDVFDVNYIAILLDEAIARNIDAIIPLNDLELPIMSGHLKTFKDKGIELIVSDNEVVDICFDKYKTSTFTESLSIGKITTFFKVEDAIRHKNIHTDCNFVIKPRWGFASFCVEYPQNNEELIYLVKIMKNKLMDSCLSRISNIDFERCVLIQRKLSGQEYGIDVVNNLKGDYEATLIRKKIAMRAGETDKATTVHENRLNKIGEEIGRKLKHIGNLDCDLIIENNKFYLLDMNPRFGGGYPFIHEAGANIPLALVEWLKGNQTPDNCLNYKDGVISSKVDKIVRMGQ